MSKMDRYNEKLKKYKNYEERKKNFQIIDEMIDVSF